VLRLRLREAVDNIEPRTARLIEAWKPFRHVLLAPLSHLSVPQANVIHMTCGRAYLLKAIMLERMGGWGK
jgi:hypothetical protein